jgi:hypothetical protein
MFSSDSDDIVKVEPQGLITVRARRSMKMLLTPRISGRLQLIHAMK